MRLRYAALLLAALAAAPAEAQILAEDGTRPKAIPAPMAVAPASGACATGVAERDLDVGGVRARLFNNGAFFWSGGDHVYEVPKDLGVDAIFTSALWIGGEVDGDLRVAGSQYGPYEFWPGPLDVNGQTDPSTCAQFDRFWTVYQWDIEAYDEDGTVTDDMASWPVAWGAPFYVDANGNSRRDDAEPITELDLGDPGYGTRSIDLAAGERPLVHGSQTIWWVMNDAGGEHGWSETLPLRVEVRVTAFGVSDPDRRVLDRGTFYRFTVHNRSDETISDAHLSWFADADLGDPGDDYVGSDSTRGMIYAYNGDEVDGGGSGYGAPPPAIGFDWLSGASSAWAGIGSLDEIRDAAGAYEVMQGRCPGIGAMTEGGQPCLSTGAPTRWVFGGNPVTGSFWSEENLDGNGQRNNPSDRKAWVSSDAFALAPGESRTFDFAIVFGRRTDRLASVTALREADDTVQALYDAGRLFDAVSPKGAPPAPAPTDPPALLQPEDGASFDEETVSFAWAPVTNAEWYTFELSFQPNFSTRIALVRAEGTTLDLSPDDLPANRVTPFYWRVRAANRLGSGPSSEVRRFTYYNVRPGVLFIGDGPAFVETASPSGIDPCGPQAISTAGCAEVGGNQILSSFNSDGTYILSVSGPAGSEASVGRFAPNDFEIRFTQEGSFAVYPFNNSTSEMTLIPVPFEVWDVGDEPPFTEPDPSDDVQMVPVLFADGEGECAFEYGETTALARPATDRIYAYYPMRNDYAAFHTAAAALIGAEPDLCVQGQAASDLSDQFVDYTRGRPLQRQIVVDNTGTGDVSTLQGTVIKFYTAARPPVAGEQVPQGRVSIGAAYPNPTRAGFTVAYRLAAPAAARVRVFDALGREVAVLADGLHGAGSHRATLEASALAAGVYTVIVEAGEARAMRRVVVVR